MAKQFYGTFYSIAGVEYTCELWDGPSGTSTPVELALASPGFSIERQGESDTFFDNPIRASRVTVPFVITTDAQLSAFQGIATSPENVWAIKVYRGASLYYVGQVLCDQIRFERADPDGKIVIQVAAVDALNLIDGFFVDGAWFTDDHANGIYLLRKCLELSGLDDYFGATDDYIFDGLEQYESATQSVSSEKLNTFWFHRLAFVDNLDVFGGIELSYVNAKQAIETILNGFGARIHHDSGAYYITQTPTYLSSTLTFHKYDKSGNYNGTSTISHAVSLGTLPARPQWAAKPQLYYQLPFRQSETNITKANGAYIKKDTFGSSVLTLTFDRPPQDHNFRVQINLESVPLSNPKGFHRVRYRVYGVDGSPTTFYYYYSGTTWNSQVSAPSYFKAQYKTTGQPYFGIPTTLTLDFVGPIATGPAANITQFKVDVYVDELIPWYYQNQTGGTWQATQVNSLAFIGAIASSYAYNTYTPGTADEFKQDKTVIASNNLTGNSQVKQTQQLFYDGLTSYEAGTIYVGSSFASAVAPTSWAVGWEVGYAESFQQAINDQVIGIYSEFRDAVRGTWHDNGGLTAVKSLYFDGGAWLLNGCNYSAQLETWEGEWIKLAVDYTDVIETGENDNNNPGERLYLENQVSVIRERLGQVEQVTGALPDQLINDFLEVSEGAPSSDPGVDGTYTIALKYDATAVDFSWQMRRLGNSLNVTSDITSFPTEYEIFVCDTTAGSITIDLPAPPSITPGLRFGFIKTAAANTLILDAGTGYLINDAQLLSWGGNWETHWVQSDGVQWYIVATHK